MAECKFYKQKEQVSYNGGQTWQDTGNERRGAYHSSGSSVCTDYVTTYRWTVVPISQDYECVGTDKYYMEKEQVSYDGGATWEYTGNHRPAYLYMEDSTDCGYTEPIYRWVDTTGYICSGDTKYNRQQRQISYNNGETWYNAYPEEFRAGSTVIEAESPDCGYVPPVEPVYRWVTEYTYCNTIDLYAHQKRQVSYDSGSTWQDVSPAQTQEKLVAYSSPECSGGEYKVSSETATGDPYFAYCPDTVISSGDVKGNASDISRITAATIGTCATEIGTNAFRGSSISYMEVPSNITELHNSTFAYCYDLEYIHFQSSTPPVFGTNTFSGCQSLKAIYVPCGSLSAYKAVSNLSSWSTLIKEEEVCGCVPQYQGDGVTAYTASTVSQSLNIGRFDIHTCDMVWSSTAYQTQGDTEVGRPVSINREMIEYGDDENEYIVELKLPLSSGTYASEWNVHMKFADRSMPNTIKYDFIIKKIKVTRQ